MVVTTTLSGLLFQAAFCPFDSKAQRRRYLIAGAAVYLLCSIAANAIAAQLDILNTYLSGRLSLDVLTIVICLIRINRA